MQDNLVKNGDWYFPSDLEFLSIGEFVKPVYLSMPPWKQKYKFRFYSIRGKWRYSSSIHHCADEVSKVKFRDKVVFRFFRTHICTSDRFMISRFSLRFFYYSLFFYSCLRKNLRFGLFDPFVKHVEINGSPS